MKRKKYLLWILGALGLVVSACGAQPTPVQSQPSPSASTQIVEPGFTPSLGTIPQSEAEVPRISVEEARAALQSGAAIVVDVRSGDAFEASHVAGAMSIPLLQIEREPTTLTLAKDEWIITYCT